MNGNYQNINTKLVTRMYLKKIAQIIAEKAKPIVKKDYFPSIPTPPAMKMAVEFVSDWLIEHKMDITIDLVKLESKQLVGISRHQDGYVERNLELEVFEPVIPQLINIRKAQKASERSVNPKKNKTIDDRKNLLLQSSDDSEFSDQSVLDDALEMREKLLEENKKKHRHHFEKSPKEQAKKRVEEMAKKKADEIKLQLNLNESDTFTEPSDDGSNANIWDPTYGLDKDKRTALEEKKKKAQERLELKKAKEAEEKKKRRSTRDDSASSYSYSTYDSYTASTYQSRKSHHHHHSRHSRNQTTYSEYSGTGYSYTQSESSATTGYSYSTATDTQTKETERSTTYKSFTSPQPSSTAPPPRPPSESSYISGYTDIDTRSKTGTTSQYSSSSGYSRTDGQSYYSYASSPYDQSSAYTSTYTQSRRTGGTSTTADQSITDIMRNDESSVYVGPSPFKMPDVQMVDQATSEHGMPNVYQPPPMQMPQVPIRRAPPVQRPQRTAGAQDFLTNFTKNEIDGTENGTTDILRAYANAPTQETFGQADDNGNDFMHHQEDIVNVRDVYQ